MLTQAKYWTSTYRLSNGSSLQVFTMMAGQLTLLNDGRYMIVCILSLEGIVVKGDRSLDYLHFSKLICPSPDVTGLGFPDLSLPSPYPSKEFALPINPDAIHIRDAVMDDLPASK